ncbi:MAG: apolipoprotein N-acyltransferase [Actinomycetota bacterium]|nr:apolipoprotein N-acyltransferase [Actinomycetota bacterium]
MPGYLRVLAAAALGGALAVAFPPAGWWPVAPIAFAGLVLTLLDAPVARGALVGLAFGLGFFLPLLHWSSTYAGALPWVLLAASQAVPVAVFGALSGPVSRLTGWPIWIAALWVAQEALRGRVPFGGFPWGRLAFSQAGAPTMPLAALGGAPLVGFTVALAGCLLAWCVRSASRGRIPVAAWAGAASVAVFVGGLAAPLPHPSGRAVTVAIVQGNVPRLGLDFNAQRQAVLRNHVTATVALAGRVEAGVVPRPDLIIWPENASDIDPFRDPSAGALIDATVREIGAPVLVGAVLDGPGAHLSNTGIVWSPATGAGQRYVKRHPVPFGEYVPFRALARRLSSKVDRVSRDFASGHRPGVLAIGPAHVGDVICFEVAYDGIVRDTVTGGADLLVVQTNNATFGRSGESAQQLAMARVRAVEHGRTVLVASTSGISAVITPQGRVVRRTGIFTRAVIVDSVRLAEGRTLATRSGWLVEWVLTGTALVAASIALAATRSRRRRRR